MTEKPSLRPRVLLLSPPVYDFALFDLFLRPYGLLRIAALLKESGYECICIDALDPNHSACIGPSGRGPKRKENGTGKFFRQAVPLPPGIRPISRQFSRYGIPEAALLRDIEEAGPYDLALISSGMSYWYPGVEELSRNLKRIMPELPLYVGGVYASLLPEHCRSLEGVDGVLAGSLDRPEGRRELDLLMERLSLPPLKGPIPLFPEMLPPLYRSGGTVLRLNRGCPYRCDYCASCILEPVWCEGDPDLLFEYLKELYGRTGVKHYAFYDDALLLGKERLLLPFLERLVRELPNLSFWTPNAMHLRLLDGQTARLMKRAGFREARFGYESDSEAFHREHDGKYCPGEAQRAFEALRGAGFSREEVTLYVLGALPGQRKEELYSAVRGAKASGFSVQIAEYSPVPGTAMWQESLRRSSYPIDREPLYQNNSFMPMEWEGLERKDLENLKRFARER